MNLHETIHHSQNIRCLGHAYAILDLEDDASTQANLLKGWPKLLKVETSMVKFKLDPTSLSCYVTIYGYQNLNLFNDK